MIDIGRVPKKNIYYMIGTFILLFACLLFMGAGARASAAEEAVDAYLTKDMDITPAEPVSSDLAVLQSVTKLASKRWIQSFTCDSEYYYYIQMTNPKKGHLRITRVKYTGLGRYIKDHMDLLYFGHATNLDCSVYNGVTYLWTGSDCASGSDVTRAITCFPYKKGKTLRHHGAIRYRIPKGKWGKYVTNVYPAINEKSNKLAVRFTYHGRQYFQTYKLTYGTRIDVRKMLKQKAFAPTVGDFQGFDLYGSHTIYTIEGSPNKAFLKVYDKTRVFQKTIIRTCNLYDGSTISRTIKGAKKLSFREPEGIKMLKGRNMQIMFVSFRLTDQSCNIYRVK